MESLIPNAKEDPLAGPLRRLHELCSSYALMASLDFPETICTQQWTSRVEKLLKKKMKNTHSFFAPLVALRNQMSELCARWEGSKSARNDLLAVITGYDDFIKNVCKAPEEKRIQLLVGPARLCGWNRVWQITQKEGRRLAGVDYYNQQSGVAIKGKRATKAGERQRVRLEQLAGLNSPQADREFAVTTLAHLLFGDCVLEKEAIKVRDIWIADIGAEVSKGSRERQRLADLRSTTGKSVTKIFSENPKLEKNYKLVKRRIESVAMACEEPSTSNLAKRLKERFSVRPPSPRSISTQFCLSLLVRPSRDKSENLLVCDGRLMAKEYRESLLPPVLMRRGEPILNLRSMLLILYRDRSLDEEVRLRLAKVNPEEMVLEWLRQIGQRNSECEQSGIFSMHEREELGLPITMSYETVSLTYRALRGLKEVCSRDGEITLGQLFKIVYPEVAALYKRFAEKFSDYKDQEGLLFPEKGFCYPSHTLSKRDPVYQGLLRVGVEAPKQQDKKTPFELLEQWFREVPLDEYNDEECAAFIAKVLKLMPQLHDLRLRHSLLWSEQVVGILEEFPQIKMLRLESFSQQLAKDGLIELGKASPNIDIAIGECKHISALDLQEIAKAQGKFSVLLGENTYRLGVADPNEILFAALELGATTVAEYCVLEGANLRQFDQADETLLHRAAAKWPLKSLEFLLSQLKDVDPRDGQQATPFLLACGRGDVEVLKLLKQCGASLKSADVKSLTGLHRAVIEGRSEAVRLLLEWGVGLDDLSSVGYNALHLAVLVKQQEMVRIIAACQDEQVWKLLDQKDQKEGATPLHLALRGSKRTEIVQLLVNAKCNVNLPDKGGSSPLHWAAEHGHVKSFEILLKAGANLCALDSKQRTAVDIAFEKGDISTLEVVIRSEKFEKDDKVVNGLVARLLKQEEKGEIEAEQLYLLGLCHELGRGELNSNMSNACKCFDAADKKGSASAQYHAAKIAEGNKMFLTAFNRYKRAAKGGHVEACYCLGLCWWTGIGCDAKNDQRGIKWFKLAAEGGHPKANFQMYNICLKGWGVKKDPWRAREYLEAAADAGHIEAMELLEF